MTLSTRQFLPLLIGLGIACSTSTPGSGNSDAGPGELTIRLIAPIGTAYARGTLTAQYETTGSPDRITLWLDDTYVKDLAPSGTVQIDTSSLSETAHLVAIHADRGAREVVASFTLVADRTAPAPEYRSPAQFEDQVPNHAPALVRLSEPVAFDPQHPPFGFTIYPPGGPPISVAGVLSVDADQRTLRFTPDAGWGGTFPFSRRDVYPNWGLTPLTDLAGNPLAYFDWSFSVSPWLRQGSVAAGPLSRPIPRALWALNSLLLPHETYAFTFDVVALDAGTWVPLGDLAEAAYQVYERPVLAGDATHLYAAAESFGGISVMSWDGGHWTKLGQTLPAGTVPTVDLLPDRSPTVAYRDFSNAGVLVHALDGGSWMQLGQTLSVLAEPGLPVSYAVGSDGTPWLALVELSGSTPIVVLRRWTGSGWSVSGAPLTSPATAESPALAGEIDGTVLVAHRVQATDGGHSIRVLRMASGAWQQLGSDVSFDPTLGDIDAPPGLGALPDGGAIVAFSLYTPSSRNLGVCFWTAGLWKCDPAAFLRYSLPGDLTPVASGEGGPFLSVASSGAQVGVEVYGPNR